MTRLRIPSRLRSPAEPTLVGTALLWGLLWGLLSLDGGAAKAQPAPVEQPKPAPVVAPRPPGPTGPTGPAGPRPAMNPGARPGVPRPGMPRPVAAPAQPVANQALVRFLSQATAAITAGDFPTAYRTLVQAYPLAPAVVLYHLGMVAAAEQHPVEARDLWRRFLADPSVEATSPLRAEAQQKLDLLPIVEAGEVVVGAPRGTQVHLDGKLVGAVPLPTPLLVQTGRHRVAVNQGRWAAETEVQVRTARQSEVRFKAGSDVAVVTLPQAVLYCDSPGLEPAMSEALTLALETALKRENYALLPRATALTYARDLPACQNARDGACCEELARRYGVDYLLDVKLKQENNDWQLDAQLRDMQVDDAAGSATPSCPGCPVDKVALRLSETATQLLSQAAARPRGTLDVTTTPPGAEVLVAGRHVGVTPYQHAMWAGSYAVELRLPGFRPLQQTVELSVDAPTQLALTLEPESNTPSVANLDPKTQVKRRPLWRIAAGASAIGVGVLMLGFGAAGLAVHDSCAVDNAPIGMCPRAYNTLGVGAGLVGAGGALAIAGTVLIALPPR